jgi:hypothetical protein
MIQILPSFVTKVNRECTAAGYFPMMEGECIIILELPGKAMVDGFQGSSSWRVQQSSRQDREMFRRLKLQL